MSTTHEHIIRTVLDLEKAASTRFNSGDVSGYLDLYRDDVTYVDPMTLGILPNKAAVKAYFDASYLGVSIERRNG